MVYSAGDWLRLGEFLVEERLPRTREEIAGELGVSWETIRDIELGTKRRLTDTIRSLAKFYGWTPDSLRLVLEGGYPIKTNIVGDAQARERAAASVRSSSLPDADRDFLLRLLSGTQ